VPATNDHGGPLRQALAAAAIAALLLTGCGEDAESDASAPSSSSPAATTTVTAPAPEPEDVAGRSNCINAGLAYAPIVGGLSGASGLEAAIRYFSAPDIDPATSGPGQDAAVAIAEMNYELALANADVLTGNPVDTAQLQSLHAAVEEACAPLR
jgi:hypothetical protein